MLALKIGSERVSVEEVMRAPARHGAGLLEVSRTGSSRAHGGHARRHRKAPAHRRPAPIKRFAFVRAVAEISASPEVMVVRGSVFGKIHFQQRRIGRALYVREPLMSGGDGGRPWVYTSPEEAREQGGSARSESLQSDRHRIEAPLRDIVKELGRARSVQRVGQARVNGRRTTEFIAHLDPLMLLRRMIAGLGSSGRGKARRRLAHAQATLRVFIAPDGLPVRFRERVRYKRSAVETTFNILATGIRVSVARPPASETITHAELIKLQRSRATRPIVPKRQLERLRRYDRCMRAHTPKRLRRLGGGALRRALRKAQRDCRRLRPGLKIAAAG